MPARMPGKIDSTSIRALRIPPLPKHDPGSSIHSTRKMASRLDIVFYERYSDKESQLYMPISIANCIKELRTARNWTQEQLAHAVGVSRQSINSIERNRYVPSLELALTFASIFSCSTDHIFHLENEK
jgi:putative transcriptional regulator